MFVSALEATQDSFGGYYIDITGNESKWVKSAEIINDTLIVYAKILSERTYLECVNETIIVYPPKEVEKTGILNETICVEYRNITYYPPENMSVYNKENVLLKYSDKTIEEVEIISDTTIIDEILELIGLGTTKENVNKYTINISEYLISKVDHIRIGEKSIVLESISVYNSTDFNVSQEVGYAHLNVTYPRDKLLLYLPFDGDVITETNPVINSSGNCTNIANAYDGSYTTYASGVVSSCAISYDISNLNGSEEGKLKFKFYYNDDGSAYVDYLNVWCYNIGSEKYDLVFGDDMR